jgi:hypothetical protein
VIELPAKIIANFEAAQRNFEYLAARTPDSVPAAPTTGLHSRGEVVFNSAPSAAGKVGFVCVASGAPGTWKAFGVIDA